MKESSARVREEDWADRGTGWTPATVPATAVAATPADAGPWRRHFAGQLAWNAASEAAARGASLWLSFVAARLLPIEGFGRFAVAMALAQYVWLAGDAVANGGYATREIARARGVNEPGSAGLAGLFVRARLGAALALTGLVVVVLAFVPMPPELRRVGAGAMLYFVAYAAFPDWALRGSQDFRGLALANAAAAVALVAGTALLLPAHPDPALAAGLWALSFAVAALVAWPRLLASRTLTWPARGQRWRDHARRSAMFSFGAVMGIGCAQAPLLLVGALGTPLETGLFGAAYRLVVAVLGVFSVLWWPLLPVLARSHPREPAFREALASVGGIALLLAFPAALAFGLHARELLSLAFGARYAPAAATLQITAGALPFYALSALLEQTCLALGGERVRARVQGTTLAFMAALGMLLVPRLGATGAALAALGGFAFSFVSYAIALRDTAPWRNLLRGARDPVLLNAALAALWLGARLAGIPPIVSLGVGGAAYVFGALALVRRREALA